MEVDPGMTKIRPADNSTGKTAGLVPVNHLTIRLVRHTIAACEKTDVPARPPADTQWA